MVLLLALMLRLPFLPTQGYPSDTRFYAQWAWKAATLGIHTLYEPSAGVTCDNHPLLLFPLKFIGALHGLLVSPQSRPPDNPTPLLLFLLRLPAVACDLLMGLAAYAWCRRRMGHSRSLAVLALVVFNPAVFCDSTLYGQVDSVHALFALTAFFLLDVGRWGWAWGLMGLALMTKPQVYVVAPLLAIVTIRRQGWRVFSVGGLACLAGAALVAAPFLWFGTFVPLVRYMLSITTIHPMVSMNADNFWWWVTNGQAALISDAGIPSFLSAVGLPLSYRLLGISFMVLLLLPVWYLAWKRPQIPGVLVLAAASVLVFFNAATQMHETYLYLAVPFLAATFFYDRRIALLYWLTTGAFVANVALHFPGVVEWLTPENPDIFGGAALFGPRLALSVVNTATLIWVLWELLRRDLLEKTECR